MAIPTTGEIRMGGTGIRSIVQTKSGTTSGTPSAHTDVSLRGLSDDNFNDFRAGPYPAAFVNIPVSGSSPDQNTPHAMSEFRGYVNAIQTVNNQLVGTASFAQVASSFNNFVVGAAQWQLINNRRKW